MKSPLLKKAGSLSNAEGIHKLIQEAGYDWFHRSELMERIEGIFGEDSSEVVNFLRRSRLLKEDSGCYFFASRGPLPDFADVYEAAEHLPNTEGSVVWLSQSIKNG